MICRMQRKARGEDCGARNETLKHKCALACVQRDVREFYEKIGRI